MKPRNCSPRSDEDRFERRQGIRSWIRALRQDYPTDRAFYRALRRAADKVDGGTWRPHWTSVLCWLHSETNIHEATMDRLEKALEILEGSKEGQA